jgi:hypothetical protein
LCKKKWIERAVAAVNLHLESMAAVNERDECASAIIEFRTLAWSLGCVENGGGLNYEQVGIVSGVLWNQKEWSEERNRLVFRMLRDGSTSTFSSSSSSTFSLSPIALDAEDENGSVVLIPFERVLEFWLGERVHRNNLVPLRVSSESWTQCCVPTSSVHTRWKRVVQREQVHGLVRSVKECARNRYYMTLATEFERVEMEEERKRRKRRKV